MDKANAQKIGGKFKRLFLIIFASVLFSANIKIFVRAGSLLPGGFTGLTLLIQQIFSHFVHISVPFSVINFILNSIPAVISFRFIGKNYTLYSVIMIILSGLLTDVLPLQPFTDDILLAAVFGGFFNALAISLCLFAGATSGGTDFIAIFISEKYGRDAWNYILIPPIWIFGGGGGRWRSKRRINARIGL